MGVTWNDRHSIWPSQSYQMVALYQSTLRKICVINNMDDAMVIFLVFFINNLELYLLLPIVCHNSHQCEIGQMVSTIHHSWYGCDHWDVLWLEHLSAVGVFCNIKLTLSSELVQHSLFELTISTLSVCSLGHH